MFSIGDFAGLSRISVRMLRHYDAIGLLRPAQVDPGSGYRFYTADQLSRVNRIIALKDLGFTLAQVQAILAELSAVADSYAPEHIGPTLTPLYPQLMTRMAEAGLQMTGPPIAYYDAAPGGEGDAVTVHAAFPVAADPGGTYDFTVHELPG